jgi:hypothetical protein
MRTREDSLTMRVPEFVQKCVGFIGEVEHRDEKGIVYGDLHGTGFFVSVRSKVRGRYLYLVTARHVAEELKDSDIFVRVNKKGGGTTEMLGDHSGIWYLHPTDVTCDVAVTQLPYVQEADILGVPFSETVDSDFLAKNSIGIGDEVFITGLFSPVADESHNMPIVRHGNIAMMPSKQIQTELGYADVYLVETRSLGGLSGSPVFVRPTGVVPTQQWLHGQGSAILGLQDNMKLLGMMHGHWDVKESEMNNPRLNHDRRGVNYGIGICVPAYKIAETINCPPLLEMRMKNDDKLKKESVPSMDSAKRDKERGALFTKDDFEIALKKASRKKN